jgi:hypothetical protein
MFVARGRWRSAASATWLVVRNFDAHRVVPCSVVVVTEGRGAVAYLHVENLREAEPLER